MAKRMAMEAIANFRDFGGYATQNGRMIKTGLLYRSASLAHASDNDLNKLTLLGIKTVCDLRTHKERAREPDRFPGNANVKSVHIPIKSRKHNDSGFIAQLFSHLVGKARKLNYDQVSKETYQEYVTNFRSEFSDIIGLTADGSNLPILIHCSAGKDRTGFACSLIQLMLGMPLERVMRDYLLSNDFLREFKAEMLNRLRILFVLGVPKQKFVPILEARSEYLAAALDQITNHYGSVLNYIREGLGFSDETIGKLNKNLIDK